MSRNNPRKCWCLTTPSHNYYRLGKSAAIRPPHCRLPTTSTIDLVKGVLLVTTSRGNNQNAHCLAVTLRDACTSWDPGKVKGNRIHPSRPWPQPGDLDDLTWHKLSQPTNHMVTRDCKLFRDLTRHENVWKRKMKLQVFIKVGSS
jgi:hypothetical protein